MGRMRVFKQSDAENQKMTNKVIEFASKMVKAGFKVKTDRTSRSITVRITKKPRN